MRSPICQVKALILKALPMVEQRFFRSSLPQYQYTIRIGICQLKRLILKVLPYAGPPGKRSISLPPQDTIRSQVRPFSGPFEF